MNIQRIFKDALAQSASHIPLSWGSYPTYP